MATKSIRKEQRDGVPGHPTSLQKHPFHELNANEFLKIRAD